MDGRAGLRAWDLGILALCTLAERVFRRWAMHQVGSVNKHKLETKKRKDMAGTTGNLSSLIPHAITGRLGWSCRYSVLRSSAEWSVLMQCCALCPKPPSASPLVPFEGTSHVPFLWQLWFSFTPSLLACCLSGIIWFGVFSLVYLLSFVSLEQFSHPLEPRCREHCFPYDGR